MTNRGVVIGGKCIRSRGICFAGFPMKRLLVRIHEGSTDALDFLITKYKSFVKMKARSYFMMGGDREDIIQEGMIGLYKAIRDYRAEVLVRFVRLRSCASQGKLSQPSRRRPGRSISR